MERKRIRREPNRSRIGKTGFIRLCLGWPTQSSRSQMQLKKKWKGGCLSRLMKETEQQLTGIKERNKLHLKGKSSADSNSISKSERRRTKDSLKGKKTSIMSRWSLTKMRLTTKWKETRLRNNKPNSKRYKNSRNCRWVNYLTLILTLLRLSFLKGR